MTTTLDAPGAVCAFASHGCTRMMIGRGGLAEHHAWPISLGGPPHGRLLALCPNHHTRQHSAIRYLVETDVPSWDVLKHFTKAERDAAAEAVAGWRSAGSPHIDGWPCPAARVA